MRTLRQCLVDCDMALLRAIAARRGIELASNRHREAVDQLASELARPESLAEALKWLSPQEREALQTLIAEGGRIKAQLFARRFGQIRPFGPGRLEREEPWRNPVSAAEGLWYLGLIYKAFDETEDGPAEFVFIPQDLLPLLPRAGEKPPPLAVEAAPPPNAVREGDLALVQDVCTFLSYLQNHEVRPLRDGSIPLRDVERLNERFLVGEELTGIGHERETERLAFLHHLCRRLRLVHLAKGLLRPYPPEAKRWLKASPAEQLRALQEAWRDDPDWNDLWRVRSLHCEDTGWRNDPLLARRKILGFLRRCPPGRWLSLDSFVAAIKQADPDFQRPDGDYESWYIREAATDRYLMGFQHWDKVEGALIAHLVAKPLHWLGATSLGYDAEGKLRSFLITPWGAAFLGLPCELPAEAPPPSMTVQPDFTVLVPAEASLYDRFQLERIAAWLSSGETYAYRLTRDSLARAFRQGIRMDMILAFLRRVSGDKVPRNVVLALRRWGEKYGQVRLRRAVLLQTRSELTLRELQKLPQTRPYLKEVISPKTAIVAEEDWPKLVEELRKLGYLPQIEGLK